MLARRDPAVVTKTVLNTIKSVFIPTYHADYVTRADLEFVIPIMLKRDAAFPDVTTPRYQSVAARKYRGMAQVAARARHQPDVDPSGGHCSVGVHVQALTPEPMSSLRKRLDAALDDSNSPLNQALADILGTQAVFAGAYGTVGRDVVSSSRADEARAIYNAVAAPVSKAAGS